MKRLGVVQSTRRGTWMIYELLDPPDLMLSRNLDSLEDVADAYPIFQSDLKKRRRVLEEFCASEGNFPKRRSNRAVREQFSNPGETL